MPNLLSLKFFIPELVLSLTAIVLLCHAVMPSCCHPPKAEVSKTARQLVAFYIIILGLLVSLAFVFKQWGIGTPPLFWGLLILDKPAAFFKVIFIITALIVVVFSQRSSELSCCSAVMQSCRQTARQQDSKTMWNYSEFYALLIGSVLGMNLLASANNLLMIYLSLEFVSLMSYLLVGYVRGSIRSSEAALKYVLYGAVASGVFLFGASLYYGITGSLDIGGVADFSLRQIAHPEGCYSIAGIFILAGFLYKIAAVPMHAWCPDAYEGAPTPITAFLSVAPKAAGFAVLTRVAQELGAQFSWPIVIAIISAVTMTFGNLAAIPQTNVKRLLAYSSIAHAGYLLMGVACFTPRGNEAVYFYFIAYLIMNLGAFLVVQIVADNPPIPPFSKGGLEGIRGEGARESIQSYSGLGRRGAYGAILAIAMTIFLLSLTGIPPFVGFIGKFYLFSAVIDARLYWLAFIGIANSVISLYYYMRVVRAMFFETSKYQTAIPVSSKLLATTLIFLALATIILGLAWQWLSQTVSGIII